MLKKIQYPIKDELKAIDQLLLQASKRDISLIDKMRISTPLVKGKKIRSTLLILLSKCSKADNLNLQQIAASIEMLHISSLIHDDIVDNSEYRRGERTVKSFLGVHLSVLWGDFLFLNSLNILTKYQKGILNCILDAACQMIEGQILEEENKQNFTLSLTKYLQIIKKKTSSLFSAVTKIPALISEVKEEEFAEFGENFGIIFQMSDDVLDLFSTQSGKDSFKDLDQKKITLPMILLRDEADIDIKEYYVPQRRDDLLGYLKKLKIKELCVEKIDFYFDQCQTFLEQFEDSEFKKLLEKLLYFIRYRDY